MSKPKDEERELESPRFTEEAHTFGSWFQSVRGYLGKQEAAGGRAGAEQDLSERGRQGLITVLCNYCVGETIALEGASGLITFAPNRTSKIFLSTQVVDEGRHVEVFLHRLRELGVADPELEIERRADRNLLEFRKRLLELIAQQDWEAALFAQNVILEGMEFAVFNAHAENADPVTGAILRGVVRDERRHIEFGEASLERLLQVAPHRRAHLRGVKQELDHLVLATFQATATELGEGALGEVELGQAYLDATRRLGLA
jgi:1,2-phenylacetyl-CoA epoxidase catalytic subunit